jgi:uncharacterized protein
MQFNIDQDPASYTIRAYRPGEISITLPVQVEAGSPRPMELEVISGSCLLSPKQLVRDWAPDSVAALRAEDLDTLADWQPEVILLGTGARLEFPAPAILARLYAQQIGVEIMDTAAACRTYNILMAEGRNVAAGLINPAVEQ